MFFERLAAVTMNSIQQLQHELGIERGIEAGELVPEICRALSEKLEVA